MNNLAFSLSCLKEFYPKYKEHILPEDLLVMIFEYLVKVNRDYHTNYRLKTESSYIFSEYRYCSHGICREWFNNGQLNYEYVFDKGERNGMSKVFYENGQLCSEIPYVFDKIHGKHKMWNSKGQIVRETTYNNGVKDGFYITWTDTGKIDDSILYKNGDRV